MKKNKLCLILFLFLVPLRFVTAQTKDKQERVILAINNVFEQSFFHVYSPPYSAKALYKDTLQAKNENPESLMSSVISASSTAWMRYNDLRKKGEENKKQFEWVKKMNREKNYFDLHNKFTFIHNGIPTAIIKFYIIQEGKPPTSGTKTMQKVGNRWYTTPVPNGMDNIAIVLMRFQSDKMMQLLDGNTTINAIMDGVIAKTRAEGNTLDCEKLMKEYASWYERKDQKMIDYFIDKNAW